MGKQMVRCPRDERVARPSAMIHLLPMRHRGSWPFLLVMSAGYRLPPKISVDQEFFEHGLWDTVQRDAETPGNGRPTGTMWPVTRTLESVRYYRDEQYQTLVYSPDS